MSRILITGSHGTGKTTLAKRLSEELSIPLLPEIARMAKEESFELNTPSIDTQLWILFKQLNFEESFYSSSFICDRSFDNIIYTEYFNILHPKVLKQMKEFFAIRTERKFDVIIFLRPVIPLVGDEARSADKDYQLAIDRLFKRYLDEYHLNYLELKSTTLENRVQESIHYILQKERFLGDYADNYDRICHQVPIDESEPWFLPRPTDL